MLPQAFRCEALKEGMEGQFVQCSRRELGVAPLGIEPHISGECAQSLILSVAAAGQLLSAPLFTQMSAKPPLQCCHQGFHILLISRS